MRGRQVARRATRAPRSARVAPLPTLLLLLLLGAGGCRGSDGGAVDTLPLPPDTGAATAAAAAATRGATTSARAPATPAAIGDTLTALGLPDPPDSSYAHVAVAAPDSGEVVPTNAELAELHAELAMPLAGVDAAKVPDTFLEARGTRVHHALDIPAPRGTPVLSAAPGRVLKLYTSAAGGLMVYAADSSDRFVLMYAHLDSYAPGLHDGQPLARGQTLGAVGTTGNAPPDVPHLHFAIARPRNVARWWTGTPVDPRPLLQIQAP